MKQVAVLLIILAGSAGLFAQAAKVTKAVTTGPRYEIVEVRRTLPTGGLDRAVIKLDTYSGQSYYAIPDVVQLADQKYVWLKMSVEGGLPTESTEARPRYRIYVLPDITYLLNIETGKTGYFRRLLERGNHLRMIRRYEFTRS
jgi:hypothetical protein